jgi:hypothetical protein
VRPLQAVCSPSCAKAQVDKAKARQAEAQRIADVRMTKAQREALKTLPTLLKEAQKEFNRYIRLRDIRAGHGCISCATPYATSEALTGGGWDAGHYRSVGSAPHLRFEPENVHLQCKRCNQHKSGNAVDYRIGLAQRIGLRALESLEADQAGRKWTRDDVRAIRDQYRAMARELEKQCQS